MNISPDEAEEALAAIQKISTRTRRSIASSGAHIFLIITGIIWLVGFVSTQFLAAPLVVSIWIGTSLAGSVLSVFLGRRLSKPVRGPSIGVYARRAGLFWLFLVLFAIGVIAVARPEGGKQITMIIILFILLGQLSMGMLMSYSSTLWALPVAALALAGYFLLPDFFYLWMGILVGGCMIGLGLYIRSRW
jgi:hypothetical protein